MFCTIHTTLEQDFSGRCEYAALRLLFAHLCNHSAAEGVRLSRDLPDGLTQGRQGKDSMSGRLCVVVSLARRIPPDI